ncbi:hypothetical protein EV368DRAFT_23015, partial [Lentinula lateritia]
ENGEDDAQAGAGIFIANEHLANRSSKLPRSIAQSNQTGKIVAAKIAAEVINPLQLIVETDLKYVLGFLKHAHELEDTGFIGTSNAELIKSTLASFGQRPTPTLLKWVKGHSGHEQNKGADTMAKKVVEKERASYINLHPPCELYVTGAKLSAMTQARAY